MADNFDFNAAPAQDGVNDMVPRVSDDDESGSNNENGSVSGPESPNRKLWETYDKYDNRWSKNAGDRHQRRYNDHRDCNVSVLSDDTEDSWDERVISSDGTGKNDIMLTHKKIVSLHRQQCYRRKHSAYVAELKAADKKLAFTKFCQLPPELRLRIWEMHCPSMLRSQRVLQLTLLQDGNIQPGLTMKQQTKCLFEFMSICQETRALGEQYMPDTLRLGEFMHDGDSILRYNAQSDILHLKEEIGWRLKDVLTYLKRQKAWERKLAKRKTKTTDKNKISNWMALPHTSVRNIAMRDHEERLREPGIYYDNSAPDEIRPEDASHRAPRELDSPGYTDFLDYIFPNVENFYVLEYGAPRKIDRWVGNDRSYERHHIRTMLEFYQDPDTPFEFLYCWHGPPKGFRGRRQALPVDSEASPAEEEDEDEAEADDGDFKDECVINHFSSLRNKGVRFSRMLYFEGEDGMEDYYRLRSLTCPDGTWPNDNEGRPRIDEEPTIFKF